ncbi:helix-turn-helix domain-containing protein [Yoonia sp. GPGPB17]|uniref:helix-turn-helix domain-containing protein n=1 Tax=Yoonia sp. GPGPB17 TaxID=3026147 RepID=UPI0030C2C9E5
MTQFARSLKTWRTARRFSQIELALEADISARHLSFLETGRANPSRQMVARLGEALQMPLDARNQMLTHAGFAVRYKGRDWDDSEMAPVRRAISWQLQRHMPYPALAIDRLWTIQEANATARTLFGAFGIGVGGSLLDLMTMETLPQVIENWAEVAHHAAIRLRTESAALGGVPEFEGVINHLSNVPQPKKITPGPVIPTILKQKDLRLAMFATITQFGTPEDLLLDDLKVELYFPLDDTTEMAFRMMGAS